MARVLIVDDRPVNREYVGLLVRHLGHCALEAADGNEAYAAILAERPDLVISDILMPNMDGYALVQRIRATPEVAQLPVIFYTATYSEPDARRLAEACQVGIVLPKPSEPAVIMEAIGRALGSAVTAAPPAPAAERPAQLDSIGAASRRYLEEVRSAGGLLSELAAGASGAEARHLQQAASAHTESLAHLQRITGRLGALVQLGQGLVEERDPLRMLELVQRSAIELIPADCVVLGVADPALPGGRQALAAGADAGWFLLGAAPLPAALQQAVSARRPVRINPPQPVPAAGLPPGHAPVGAWLAVPLVGRSNVLGWLYFAYRGDALRFTDEDEWVATTLAASAATALENAGLYKLMQGHAADLQLEVTQRRRAEAERAFSERRLQRLNRIYRMLSDFNALVVHTRDRQQLLKEACRIAVEEGGFKLAWIGEFNARGDVVPRASSGMDGGFFEEFGHLLLAATPESESPVIWQLRKGKAFVSNDVMHEHASMVPRQQLWQRGLGSLVALPLFVRGAVVGVFALYADAGFLDDEETGLLTELANDVSFAMQSIARDQDLDELVHYDPLTGLANRRLFIQRLEAQLHQARQDGKKVAVVHLDLHRFKAINETLGIAAGDEALRQVAQRLLRFAVYPELIARLGGDEFGLMLPQTGDTAELGPLLEQEIVKSMSRPLKAEGQEFRLATRLGIALFPDHGKEAVTLLHNAEAALNVAQAAGRHHMFYEPQMSHAIRERLGLETQLARALENQEFLLYYQPKVDARSGEVCGCEALLRWNSPELGLVPPLRFIGVLEETGMIREVGRWALEQALADYRAWERAGIGRLPVAVNISAFQLHQADFIETIRMVLAEAEASAAEPGLQLEVTESMLIEDVESSIIKLKQARGLGLAVAIDDFGTGYSSLAYLARLPIEAVKIDRSFVSQMTEQPDALSIISTIVSLAQSMNLTVIAEGVESAEQLKLLRLLRCNQVQGYLCSPPVPAARFAELAARRHLLP